MFNSDEEKDNKLVIYVKAILRGLILSLLLVIIVALAFYFGNLKDSYIDTSGWIISILGICYSAIYCANKIGKRGFLHGAIIGAIYMAIIYIIVAITQRSSITAVSAVIKFVMAIIVGALSGMIGIIINDK